MTSLITDQKGEKPAVVEEQPNDNDEIAVGASLKIENGSSDHATTPLVSSLPRWYPVNCFRRRGRHPIYYGNPEALGWAFDCIGRSAAFIGSGAFLGTALLELAKEAAGCSIDPDPETNRTPECTGRIFGIRPSSLLTSYTLIIGVLSAAMLPLMGAMLDYTPHRRWLGRFLSASYCILLIPQIFISSKTWVMVALVQIGVAFVGWAQSMVTHSYLPELTDSPKRLNEYSQSFTIVSFSTMALYLAVTTSIAKAAGWSDDSVATARLGVSIALAIGVVFLSLSWGSLMQRRPAAHVLPQNQSLWTAGFIQIYRTIGYICRHLRALMWFYLSIAFVDSGLHSLATILITYLTDSLGFSSSENGIAILFMLIGSVPGALIAGRTISWFNPVRSSAIAILLLIINTIIFSTVLNDASQLVQTYVLFSIYGVCVGWKWTTDRLIASLLIPSGQDAELMGVYLFAGQILSWIPPLIYTILNEIGVSQSFNIGFLSFYFALGLLATILIGDYDAAIAQTGRHYEIS